MILRINKIVIRAGYLYRLFGLEIMNTVTTEVRKPSSARLKNSHVRMFRSYVPTIFLMLALADALILMGSLYLGTGIRFDFNWNDIAKSVGVLWPSAVSFAAVVVLVGVSVGLYGRNLREGLSGLMLRVLITLVLGTMVSLVIYYMFPSTFVGRGGMLLTVMCAYVGMLICRSVFLQIVGLEALKRRVLVLGAGKYAEQIERLSPLDRLGFTVVGYVEMPGDETKVPEEAILPLEENLLTQVSSLYIDEIVVAMDDRRGGFDVDQLLDCKMSGKDVVNLLTFFERETAKIKLDIMQPSYLIFSDGFPSGMFRVYLKRWFDVSVASVFLLFALPIMLGAVLAIKLEGRGKGSILYRQERVGQGGKTFGVLKFRSMREDAEKDGVAQWAQKNDDRITRVGKIMRPTRIDELPQLFNVLRGDMSFVGPRPERPQFVTELNEQIPYYAERHRVKPGITGWAQISYPYGATVEDAVEKLQYDLFYVKNYSMFFDLMVILQTVEVILWQRGAR